MEINAIIGLIVLIGSVSAMTILTFWSRKRIDKIAEKKSASAREIMQEMKNGK